MYDAWTVQNIYNITSDTVPAKDVPKVVPFLNERSRLVFNLIRGAPNYNNVSLSVSKRSGCHHHPVFADVHNAPLSSSLPKTRSGTGTSCTLA